MEFRTLMGISLFLSLLILTNTIFAAPLYDIAITNGRIIDPESNLDAVNNIGINDGVIQVITTEVVQGHETFNASGLIVSPGFIDLNMHLFREEWDKINFRVKAMDGVTTGLDLEGGSLDVDRWYSIRKGKALINYGVSIGHIDARRKVMRDPSPGPKGDAAYRAASESELKEIRNKIEYGLKRGAVGVGMAIQYTPAATREEILEIFYAAAKYNAPCFVHVRYSGSHEHKGSINALREVLDASETTRAPLHVCHINSTGLQVTPTLLKMIGEAQTKGLDVTTECYPYTAGATGIQSALFIEGWQQILEIDYGDLEWAATGERLTEKTFKRYRKKGGWVIIHAISEDIVYMAVTNPLTIIASDSLLTNQKKGHPRSSGTFSRVLGQFVRDKKGMTWIEAIRKMTLMPARRLEGRIPMMKRKGRIQIGADADITIFDPERVRDKSTFKKPAMYSEGIEYVLVNGVPVVEDGRLQKGVSPGHPIRAAIIKGGRS